MKENSMTENNLINISDGNQIMAYLIRSDYIPIKSVFITPPEFKQQIGYIIYPEGSEIARHIHLPIQRKIVGTSEVLIVKKGHCLIDIYNDGHELVATHELFPGDVILMVSGGHGFRMLEDTVFLEIKQGPYLDMDEKERF